MRARARTHTHIHTHTHTHTHMHACMHAHTHTVTHACTLTRVHMHTHAHTHTHTHSDTCMYTHMRAHAHTRTRMHTHTRAHVYIHTCFYFDFVCNVLQIVFLQEIFLTIIRIEENLLSKVQKERLLLSPHLHEMLKEYLESMCTVPKDGVFTWPWSLLRMAVFAHNMMEDVSKIVQNLLSKHPCIRN